ncbi:DUF6474 family protein [Corynebacterium sp. sy039]|uniref:DUF6474 family protein n=1 Tax=Corynebacterium sp. sy039 TaxID=2599641 RepID=UPI0011B506E2|nr:DUF6474 family protein [Corynebacterium sp. sy039]QDZ43388.1 hypothetical protein FQV43_09705 [Corynebacterium sp. sy039]
MGLLKKARKKRAQAKKELKVAKSRARQEVKSAAKLDLKRDKLLAKQEKHLLKEEKKGLKAKRKHEKGLAKTELEKLKAGQFNKDTVLRYSGAARTLAPFILPLLYRGVVAVRGQLDAKRAQRLGISSEELGQFSGHGAPLKARILKMRDHVKTTQLAPGFIQDVHDRLDELSAAVDNAEYMTTEQRKRAHRSIAAELDALAREIQHKLTK